MFVTASRITVIAAVVVLAITGLACQEEDISVTLTGRTQSSNPPEGISTPPWWARHPYTASHIFLVYRRQRRRSSSRFRNPGIHVRQARHQRHRREQLQVDTQSIPGGTNNNSVDSRGSRKPRKQPIHVLERQQDGQDQQVIDQTASSMMG